MVMLGEERERGGGGGGGGRAEKLMAMGPERSKPLHNFKMPCLKWGNQKLLRCMKMNPNGEDSSSSADQRFFSASKLDKKGLIEPRRREELEKSPSPAERRRKSSDGDQRIDAFRTKLLFHLQTAADKIKDAILRKGSEEEEEERPAAAAAAASVPAAEAETEASRPWNLRTRRAACKAPNGMNGNLIIGGGGGGGGGGSNGGGAKSLQIEERKPNYSPSRTENKSPKLRGDVTAAAAEDSPTGEKRERAKFSVSLSRREIEDDFMNLTGHRPPRRPKKRPKIVQKQLDTLFPGLWMTEITADIYKVPDVPETGNVIIGGGVAIVCGSFKVHLFADSTGVLGPLISGILCTIFVNWEFDEIVEFPVNGKLLSLALLYQFGMASARAVDIVPFLEIKVGGGWRAVVVM
ncbi:unnamed protein product [Camellia sinensis]